MFFSSVPLSTGCTSTVRGVLKDLIFKIVSLFEHFSETRNCSLPFPSSHSESPSFCKPGREGGGGRLLVSSTVLDIRLINNPPPPVWRVTSHHPQPASLKLRALTFILSCYILLSRPPYFVLING